VNETAIPIVFWLIIAVMIAGPVALAMRRWIPPVQDEDYTDFPVEAIGDHEAARLREEQLATDKGDGTR
jgi:hypothetical protein